MVTLDFSNCKTPEDVHKVFNKEKKTLQMIKREFEELNNSQSESSREKVE